ncbi:hypothetical protein NKH97_00515 [Mesorhizobium sp. M0870]
MPDALSIWSKRGLDWAFAGFHLFEAVKFQVDCLALQGCGEDVFSGVHRSFHVQHRCVTTPVMKTLRSHFRTATLALCAAGLFASQAMAMPVIAPPDLASPIVLAASDCYAIGQQVAEQNGGTLAKASQSTRGGQPVCVIVVLVPGKDGQRPRRSEIVVPLN